MADDDQTPLDPEADPTEDDEQPEAEETAEADDQPGSDPEERIAEKDAYIAQLLLPTLVPGQIVVCDRLPVHKRARARALIEGAGCELRLLPSYSPDFNPIELAFAKIKQALRGAAERTFADIVAATGPALDAVTAADAQGFFAHCGYPLPGQVL